MILHEINFNEELTLSKVCDTIRAEIEKEPDFLPRSSEPEVGPFLFQFIQLIQAKTVLEIGTFKGYTTCKLIESGVKVTSVDIKDQRHSLVKELQKFVKNFEFFEQDSLDYLRKCRDSLRRFDLIYIDGDHDLDHVKKELLLLSNVVPSTGIMVFHDATSANCPGVIQALMEYREQYRTDFVVLPTSRGCGLAIL